ncbi:uncharacterized protein LOC108713449 [Xenopus laevis]|uniref:Uncharacterized protein LOC108713449 n=2 Tax=Xenopus laevis TaxID=8355 RepID=A0A1L8GIH2_XENLA|nr:uncharacterized protein LOC108713449 [Xenopus laevis]XP_041445657.1 uncharacterized protein LOC108713449 [Xenopus laevis]OCT83632.1 hypothetical protein XELAEV_18021774mg [Xenopus laevis]
MASKKADKQESMVQFASSSRALEGPITPFTQKLKTKGMAKQKLERLLELESRLCRRKDKSKKSRINQKPLDVETEALFQLCKGRNTTPLKEHSNKSSSKKKNKDKKKRRQDGEESVPPVKNCRIVDVHQNGDMLLTLFKIKNRKENTPAESLDSSVCSPLSRNHSPNSANERKKQLRKNLYTCMTVDQAQSARVKLKEMEDLSQRAVAPKYQSVSSSAEGSSRNHCPLPALPSPVADPKGDGKSLRSVPNEGSSMLEEIASSSGHSQDLFITQKSFMPVEVLGSSSSGSSPPLGQDPGTLRIFSRTDTVQVISQVSTFTVKGADQSSSASIKSDKSTQTEDVFSYLTLMSLMNRVRVMEKCSEQPLDFALPNRSRSNIASPLVCIKVEDDDIIFVDVKHANKLTMSQQRRMEDAKLVQTFLNSSYYFKGKGDHCSKFPLAPLLKMKMETKKRSRKSRGLRH